MSPTQEAAIKMALEALDGGGDSWQRVGPAIDALKAALAEPVEPAAIVGTQEDTWKGYGGQWAPPGPPIKTVHMLRELPEGTLLYAAPPQRPAEPVQEPVEPVAYIHRQGRHWEVSERPLADDEKARGWTEEPLFTAPPQRKPLTDEEIKRLVSNDMVQFARAIERAHGITP